MSTADRGFEGKEVADAGAKLLAILDLIPEAAAICGPDGAIEHVNAAGRRDPALLFGSGVEGVEAAAFRTMDGRPLRPEELPAARAARGESPKGDYFLTDPRSGEERVVNVSASPVYSDSGAIIGSVILARDVTGERHKTEREAERRRRTDCLARLSVDLVASESAVDHNLAARTVAESIHSSSRIYLYNPVTDQLELVGAHFASAAGQRLRQHLVRRPYRIGDGLPGAVFQIGRPLLFAEIRGDAVVEFGRTPTERQLIGDMREQSLIACPIEFRGDRIGALVISSDDPRTSYDAEDLDFAVAAAERIGAALHIHRLNRISQEGHRAAQELARREVEARSRFEAVLDSAPVGIAVVSPDELRFELVNSLFQEYATRFGKVSSDTRLIGLRAAEVVPGLEQVLREAAERREARIDEALEVRRDRHSWYIKQIVSPVFGRFSGETQSLTILMQDVSEQVLANSEIEALAKLMEERSARLDSIIGSMTDALLVYDSIGSVVDVNPAALAMFGLGSRREAVARGHLRDFELRYPDGTAIPGEELPYARALRGEVVPDFVVLARQLITGQDLDLSIAAAPIESGGAVMGAVLVARDITALQELDRKKDEFLSVASHELRTPLTTIKGYAQLLAQNPTLDLEDRATFLSAVLGEVERMMGLISELLDVSRIETKRLQIHTQPMRWIDFLRGQAAKFRVQNADRTLLFTDDVPEVVLEVDGDRMRQVVDNLLSNAVKYSPEQTPIELHARVFDDRVETSVVDHGIGIPADELPRLFERFHRASNVSSRYYGGLGLGLYIARAIIESHGGAIRVESDEGNGSTFTMTLPRIVRTRA